jgi:monoterpene epsilon-lactone hydrolase
MDFFTAMKGVRVLVRARRRLRGPRLPSWDEDFETWATVLHQYGTRSTWLPLAWQRKALGWAPRPPAGPLTYERVNAGGVPAEWFRTAASDPSRVLLYLHGGGYSIGSIDSHREFIGRLCDASGLTALAIDYRLAPEHPFPAQLDDARAAYHWLLDGRVAPAQLIVAGESAGAGLTLSLLLSLRDRKEPLPAGAACISPWLDLEADTPSMRDNASYDYLSQAVMRTYAARFVKPHDLRNPLAAPIHADLRGLPPLFVQVGGAEVLLDDSTRLAARAGAAGVRVELDVAEDMIHAYPMFASFFPRCQRAVDDLARFARARTGLPTEAPAVHERIA